jgi:hypothetical protein
VISESIDGDNHQDNPKSSLRPIVRRDVPEIIVVFHLIAELLFEIIVLPSDAHPQIMTIFITEVSTSTAIMNDKELLALFIKIHLDLGDATTQLPRMTV